MKYEWDAAKNTVNIEKHGIDFSEAHELFGGNRLIFLDARKDYGEERFITVGLISDRLIVAVYTQRQEEIIRIISIRKANSREKERYEKTVRN
jgi:uncharacterized protein